MLNGVTHYHGIVRKVIVSFGRLFSDVRIVRYDKEGNPLQTIVVPIAYAPKEKWTARLEGDPSLNNTLYNVLPRLSFEITGFSYDANRALNKMNPIVCPDVNTTSEIPSVTRKQVLTPSPYNVDISLYVLTKTTEDGLAILEQILPVFKPDYTLSIKAIPDLNLIMDVPIILNNVTLDDQYEGNFEDRRVITYTYNFTAKINLFGAMNNVGVINNVLANLSDTSGNPISNYEASAQTPVSEIQESWNMFGEDF